MGTPPTRRTAPPPGGSLFRQMRGPNLESHAAHRSARTKPSGQAPISGISTGTYRYRREPTLPRFAVSRGCERSVSPSFPGRRRRRLSPGTLEDAVSTEEQEQPENARQDACGHVKGHHVAEHRADRTPDAHPEGSLLDHVALPDVRHPPDRGRRNDGGQRRALGQRLREAQSDRHEGDEEQSSADSNRPTQKADQEPDHNHQHVRPAHGWKISLAATAASNTATPIFNSRSGMYLSNRA